MKKTLTLLAVTTALCDMTSMAHADIDYLAKERFLLRARALAVVPDESSDLNIGGDLGISNSYTPEIDLSYFFTENIAVEAIAATTKHDIKYSSTANVGSTWVLPPTVTLQYHFTPEQKFSPYVGAGLNYSFFYGEKSSAGFNDLNVNGGVGYALQAGFDYWLDDHWGLNLDIKKLFLNMDATVNNGAIQADINLDPWLFGAGVSYRF